MKKLIAILIASAFACAFAPMIAGAPNEIVVTLTPGGTAEITASAGTWDGEGAILGSGTTYTATNTTFNIENTGTVACTVEISAVATADWTLDADGSPAKDSASLLYQIPTHAWTYITGNPETFGGTLEVSDTTDFGLGVAMPETSSTNAPQTFTITFTATEVA